MPSSKKNKQLSRLALPQIRCVWAIVCGSASVDQMSNNFSIFNIIEELHLPSEIFQPENSQKPIPIAHELVVLFKRVISSDIDGSEFQFDILIELIDPQEKSVAQMFLKFSFLEGKERMRLRMPIPFLPPLSLKGTYLYKISYKPINQSDFRSSDCFEIPINIDDKKQVLPGQS